MVYTTYQNCDLGDGVWHFVYPHYQSPKIGRSGVPLGPISSTKLPCTGFLPCERLVSSIPGTRHLGSEICNAYHVDVLQNQYASNLQMQKCKHNQPEEPRLPTLPWPTLQENSLQVPLLKKKPGLHSAHSCGFFIIILDFGTFFCLLCFAFPAVFQVLPQNLATSYSSNQTGFQPTP